VFRLSTGPSKEAVMRIHERAGHPTTEVYELSVEVTSLTMEIWRSAGRHVSMINPRRRGGGWPSG